MATAEVIPSISAENLDTVFPPNESLPSDKDTKTKANRVKNILILFSTFKKQLFLVAAAVLIIICASWFIATLGTVSTDDAYISGHVTFVAARVPSQVLQVLVDDNNRVHKGDLLVRLDSEPYQVQVDIADAALKAAQADLVAARAQVQATEGQMRSLRFNLEHAVDDVNNQVALLRSKVASLESQKANLAKAQADYDRAAHVTNSGAVTKEEVDHRRQGALVAKAQLEQALQEVYQVRVALGLKAQPEAGEDLSDIPPDLDQRVPSVRQAQASLQQVAAQVGVTDSFNKSPRQMIADFYKRDPSGNIDQIYANILKEAPVVKQAEAKLIQAERNLDQALLNLRYTDIRSEIDGVVTRRAVNPGNNVSAGQSLMAVRSLSEIWIDANFKETQLKNLRIGQPVDIEVDMYGSSRHFKGRVTGFTMGTGSTLALLPAENATGNFVKVVQRLPVRIDLIDYDPDTAPLFIGLSVTPKVRTREDPSGADAGRVLQPFLPSTPSIPGSETQS